MKKTLIALLVMTGMATAAVPYWEDTTVYNLDGQSSISTSSIGDTTGYIITKTGGDTSPAALIATVDFSLTSFGSANENFVSFLAAANTANSLDAYGFVVNNTGTLSFGRMGTGTITSTTAGCALAQSAAIATLALNTNYSLTLQSHATGTPVGRGNDNFTIVLTNLDDISSTPVRVTTQGFGLNGNAFGSVRIGSNLSTGTLAGTVTKLSIIAPEPATATLSLLALAALATRRKRH